MDFQKAVPLGHHTSMVHDDQVSEGIVIEFLYEHVALTAYHGNFMRYLLSTSDTNVS